MVYDFQKRVCNLDPHSHALKTTKLHAKITRIAEMALALDIGPWLSDLASGPSGLAFYCATSKTKNQGLILVINQN